MGVLRGKPAQPITPSRASHSQGDMSTTAKKIKKKIIAQENLQHLAVSQHKQSPLFLFPRAI